MAVWPPEEVLDRIAALDRPAINGLRWTERYAWHVTLRFLGPVPEVDPVVGALVGMGLAPTRAVLGPAVGCFGQRILHVPVAGLDELAAAVTARTATFGKPPDARPFRGHITLARGARRDRIDLRPLTRTAVDGAWDVDSVCLVESWLHPTGARYEVLERFPLIPA